MATLALDPALPQTIREAFAHIGQVKAPTIADFKVMVLVEAASETLYRRTAEGTDNPAVIALLHANGVEEMKHARRVSEVIRVLGGGDFPAPAAQDNPYLAAGSFPFAEVTADALRKLSAGEFGGEALYEGWAASIDNAEADLLRANGREETDHGNRLLQAAALLEG